ATGEDLTFAGTSCCSQQPGPNLAAFPQTSSLAYGGITITLTKQSFGGDQTGAVMISKFIKPGTVSTVQYNHYSMLKSIEDIFQLGHLGYAGQAGLVGFGNDIFTNL
ncbi:MAG: alkaline phosphatase family protein, partial [Paraburkholderia sp.]